MVPNYIWTYLSKQCRRAYLGSVKSATEGDNHAIGFGPMSDLEQYQEIPRMRLTLERPLDIICPRCLRDHHDRPDAADFTAWRGKQDPLSVHFRYHSLGAGLR